LCHDFYLTADAATSIFIEKLEGMLETLKIYFIKFRHLKLIYNGKNKMSSEYEKK